MAERASSSIRRHLDLTQVEEKLGPATSSHGTPALTATSTRPRPTAKKPEAQVEADSRTSALLEQSQGRLRHQHPLPAQSRVWPHPRAEDHFARRDRHSAIAGSVALISGRINAQQFDVGNYVGDGKADVLHPHHRRVDPIYAYILLRANPTLTPPIRTLAARGGCGQRARTPGSPWRWDSRRSEGIPTAASSISSI